MPRCVISQENAEKLIELVRDHPVLYDNRSSMHHDADLIHNTWTSIAKILNIPGKDGTSLKKYWRNLRDTFVKKKKATKTRSGQAAKQTNKWKFMDMMLFLDDYIEESSTESNVPPPQNDESASDTEDTSSGPSDVEDDTSCIDTSVSLTQTTQTKHISSMLPSTRNQQNAEGSRTPKVWKTPSIANTVTHNKRKRRREASAESESGLSDTLQNFISEHKKNSEVFRNQCKQSAESKSADDAFFESCALRIKKLPDATRSLLQLQILQLFHVAENPKCAPISLTPYQQQQYSQNQHMQSTNTYQQPNHSEFQSNNEPVNSQSFPYAIPSSSSTDIIAQAIHIASTL